MKDIISTLNLVQRLACNLEAEKVSAIERDLALEKLRAIYDLLLGATVVAEEEVVEEPEESVIELIEDIVDEVEEFANEDEPEVEEEIAEEPAPEEEPEDSVVELIEELVEEVEEFANEDELEVEESVEPEPEVKEEPAVAVKTKLAHSAILALYDDDDDEESAPAEEEPVAEEEVADEPAEEVEEQPEEEPVVDMTELDAEEEEVATEEEVTEEPAEVAEEPAEVAEEPAEEQEEEPATEPIAEPSTEPAKVVLGDVLGADQTTLADRIAANAVVDVASAVSAAKSLAEMIGLNDKFILMRDLFQNNHDYYEAAIDQLDEFESIDEAMLFIHDNFQWNPNSEGAKLLVELLSNKLL